MATDEAVYIYVYGLRRPDTSLFYIGKGRRHRATDHEREAKRGHDCSKCDAIRSIWSSGGTVGITIFYASTDDAEALRVEHALIVEFGAELVNATHVPSVPRQRPVRPVRSVEDASQSEWLTRREAAEYLGVSVSRVQELTAAGRLGRLVGVSYAYSKAELDRYKIIRTLPRPGRPRKIKDQSMITG